jgi:hypothetical protein
MQASHTVVGVVFLGLLVGCNQSTSPTGPSSGPAHLPSITATAANAAGTGLSADVVVAAATKEVPFEGKFEGTYTFVPDPPPSTFASVHLEATGNATHLGRFRLDAPHRVNTANLPVTATGVFTFTAANGDTVTADFTGLGTPTETPGVFAIAETATITGGTGRFAAATGSFIVRRVVDLSSPLATGSFEGTISSPAIGRP